MGHVGYTRNSPKVTGCSEERLVAVLMHNAEISGLPSISKAKAKKFKVAAPSDDLVNRQFAREGLNELWVSDIERHEALLNREGVQDPLRQSVAAGW
jgi:hypothetical protein